VPTLNDWPGVRVDKAFLEFSRGGHREMIAMDSGRFTLGRASGNDLGFPEDGTVSGQHAVIEQQADGWLIRDLDSVNGTSVNGQKISGPQMLGSGDSILLGQTQLAFCVVRPEQSPVAPPPPSGYLDITEEWGRAATPSVPAQPAGPTQDVAARQLPQQPVPGSGHGSPVGAEQQRAWAPDARTSLPKGGTVGRQQARRGHGRVRGTARGVHVRQGSNILSFRVERYDVVGNRLPPVGAELVGFQTGELGDGEDVEVSGRWSHGTLQATKIINLSTGAQVRGASGPARAAILVIFALVLTFVAVITIVIIIVILKSQS
jgi:pSer/pThr/pTyr-binding forkhead associated (FHA) protein